MLKRRISVAFMGMVIFLAASLLPAYSASLSDRDERLIQIAFMNGFVTALNLDDQTLAELREDKQHLKRFVLDKAEEYVNRVEALNRRTGH